MKTLRALAFAGVVALSGCSGFYAGFKHATTGIDDMPIEQTAPGYNVGVLIGNLAVAASGYLARHFQDKLIRKGEDGLPK